MNSLPDHLVILSRLLWSPPRLRKELIMSAREDEGWQSLFTLREDALHGLLAVASSHHVVLRSLPVFSQLMAETGNTHFAAWADHAIKDERARIDKALFFLASVVNALQEAGCDVLVIKSLDHWPDLGSDLDLYTNAPSADVIDIMKRCFHAQQLTRSWGDILAHKWNFRIPGLGEAVEMHVGRLGQTGELVAASRAMARRSIQKQVGKYSFAVPANQDRLLLATLQRMYRHFYLRLCDIADTAQLVETESIDYEELRHCAQTAGIWKGIATFLSLVSDYVQQYRSKGLDLPALVKSSSLFSGKHLTYERGFLRIPLVPHAVNLYATELTTFLQQGNLQGTIRLSLLPFLATAAVLEHRITGSAKIVW